MDYNTKYKDRNPRETIRIIEKFFSKNNFETMYTLTQCYDNTYSTITYLKKGKDVIMTTNGKGETPDYAIASGMGELYERFCGIYGWHADDYVKIKILKKKDKELFAERKIKYVNLINSEDILYLDDENTIITRGSNGLSCGNTLEEALNQGISEICERYVENNFLDNEFEKLYALNIDSIQNKRIRKIINNILADNNSIYILDFGYNYKTPVIGVIIIDKSMKRMNINFGCFPVFEIALERCLTEIYQNIGFSENINVDKIQTPFRCCDNIEELKKIIRCSSINCYQLNEEIFEKIEFVNKKSDIFINANNVNNSILYEYWLNYINQNKIKIYMHNTSISKDMVSIQLYTDFGYGLFKSKTWTEKYNNVNLAEVEETMKEIYEIYKSVINNNFDKFYIALSNLLNKYKNNLTYIGINKSLGGLLFKKFGAGLDISTIDKILNKIIRGEFAEDDSSKTFFNDIKKYTLLNSVDNIELLEELTGYQYSEADIKNKKNKKYLLNNIFFKKMVEYYNSKDLDEIATIMEISYDK